MVEALSGDIEAVTPGSIRVRPPNGQFQRVDTPKGFTDYAFRTAVSAFDTAYRTLGKLPSVTEVHAFWPKLPTATYSALFLTVEFKQALAYRGVEWEVDNGLSIEQSMLLLKLLDFSDKRSLGPKLKELGIPMSRYQAWMNQPLFKESYRTRSEAQFKDAVPMALNKLIANADSNDQRAIEKVLEITGRWNPAQQQIEDVRAVVVKVMESVIRNVKDPEVRRAVMNDIGAEVVSFDLTHPQSLEE